VHTRLKQGIAERARPRFKSLSQYRKVALKKKGKRKRKDEGNKKMLMRESNSKTRLQT